MRGGEGGPRDGRTHEARLSPRRFWITLSVLLLVFSILPSEYPPVAVAAVAGNGASLSASQPPAEPVSADQVLTAEQLDTIAAQGTAAWSIVDPSADFSAVTFSIVDLPDLELGRTTGKAISIDPTAAGHGWSVVVADGGPRMDLRTVVLHELGHVLGYEHTDQGLMAPTLAPGETRGIPPLEPPPVEPSAEDVGKPAVGDPIPDDPPAAEDVGEPAGEGPPAAEHLADALPAEVPPAEEPPAEDPLGDPEAGEAPVEEPPKVEGEATPLPAEREPLVSATTATVGAPASVAAGSSVNLTVSGVSGDNDPDLIDEVTVTVVNMITGEQETVSLQETDPAAGVFQGSLLTVNDDPGVSGDAVIHVADGDVLDVMLDTEVLVSIAMVVGHMGALTGPERVLAGDPVTVEVTDLDLPADVMVEAMNVTTGETELLTLAATDVIGGVFAGSLETVLAAGPGAADDGILNVQPGNTIEVTYRDSLGADGLPSDVSIGVMVTSRWTILDRAATFVGPAASTELAIDLSPDQPDSLAVTTGLGGLDLVSLIDLLSLLLQGGAGDDTFIIGPNPLELAISMTIDGGGGADTVAIEGDLNLLGKDLTISAENIGVGFAIGDNTRFGAWAGKARPSDWTPNQLHSAVEPSATSGTGTGLAADLSVDDEGTPTVRLVQAGAGYVVGDTVTFAPPDGTGEAVTMNVLSAKSGGVTVSTRSSEPTGDSGNITFTGEMIAIGLDSSLLADSTGSGAAGDVTLSVFQTSGFQALDILADVDASLVGITINDGAAVRGGNVSLSAKADHSRVVGTIDADGNTEGSFRENVLDALAGIAESIDVIGGVAISTTDVRIHIDDAVIEADTFTAEATAISDASTAPISIGAGVAVAIADTTAEVRVRGSITTSDDLTIRATADNTLSAVADTSGVLGAAGAVAVSVLDSDTLAWVTDDATLTVGGTLLIDATTVDRTFTLARSTAGEDGFLGVAVAISDEHGDTSAFLDGTANVAGNIEVRARQEKEAIEASKLFVIPSLVTGVAAVAGVGGDSKGDLLDDTQSSAIGKLIDFVKLKILGPSTPKPGKVQSFDLAASVAYVKDVNNAIARLGDGGVDGDGDSGDVEADGSILVNARIENRPDVTASSQATTGNVTTNSDPSKFGGSAAVALGFYTNNATAEIGAGAEVDAGNALAVRSEALNDYEWTYGVNLWEAVQDPENLHITDEGTITVEPGDIVEVAGNHTAGGDVGTWYEYQGANRDTDLTQEDFTNTVDWVSLGNPTWYKAGSFVRTLTTYLDSNLGLDSNVVDSWSQATASADAEGLSIAGAVTVLSLDHTSRATIAKDALINQDGAFRSGEQNVVVEAISVNQAVHFGGNIQLPGIAGNTTKFAVDFSGLKPRPTGEGSADSVGVTVLVIEYANTVDAGIDDGAVLYADSLAVDAETRAFSVAVAASGGKAGNFGFNGVAVAVDINNKTYAQIENGATVTVGSGPIVEDGAELGSLLVRATDTTDIVSLAGGVAVGENIGVGASVVVHQLERDTQAVIGNRLDDGTDTATGSVTAGGSVVVRAVNTGFVGAFAVAAAVTSETPDKKSDADSGVSSQEEIANDDPLDGISLPILFGDRDPDPEPDPKKQQGKTGIGLAGDVAITIVTDDALAYVKEAGNITVNGGLRLEAADHPTVVSLAGSVALSLGGKDTSVGIAGSLGFVRRGGTTEAFIDGAALDVKGLTLVAHRDGNLVAIVAGGAGATGKEGTAIAGSVAINRIEQRTETKLANVTGTVDGSATQSADDDSNMVVIAGSAGFGGKGGYGAAVAWNDIRNQTRSTIDHATGLKVRNVDIEATNDSDIVSVTGSLGVGGQATGAAGTVSLNFINSRVDAMIDSSSINSTGAVSVIAEDDANIFSLAGGFAAGKTTGFGAALAYNKIDNDPKAAIVNSELAAAGALTVRAESTGTIGSISAGAAGSKDTALAGAISLNSITNTVDAHITTNRDIVVIGDITVQATDAPTIRSLAGEVAGAGKTTFGAAIAWNDIGDSTSASITTTTTPIDETPRAVVSSDNNVEVGATTTATVRSISAGIGGSGKTALGGSISINEVANTTEAYVDGEVVTPRNVVVSADDELSMVVIAGNVSGAGKNAAGGASATIVTNNTTTAFLAPNSVVSAGGNGEGMEVLTGTKTGSTKDTVILNGLAVVAVSFEKVLSVAGAGSGGGDTGIAGSANVVSLTESTSALIGEGSGVNETNANPTSSQVVSVLASDKTDIIGVAGGIGGGGDTGFGAGVDVGTVAKRTEASIGSKTIVNAARDVLIQALSGEKLISVAASLAGGGNGSLGGSVGVSVLDLATTAFVDGADTSDEGAVITAEGSVLVSAADATEIDAIAGNVGAAGKASIGVAAVVPIVKKKTEAYIGGHAVVDGLASSSSTIDVATGEIGGEFVNYARAVDELPTFTNGEIDDPDIEVSPDAPDDQDFDRDGTPDDVFASTLTQQRVATVQLSPFQGVAVTAVNTDDIMSIGGSAGGAGSVAVNVGGSVHVMNAKTLAHIDENARVNTLTEGGGDEQGVRVVAADDYQHIGIAAALGLSGTFAATPGVAVSVVTHLTEAYIDDGATVNATGDLEVIAHAAESVISVSAGVAGSGTVAVGGAVGVTVVDSTTHAHIGHDAATESDGADVTAKGNVVLSAQDETNTDWIAGSLGVGIGGGGAGMSVGVTVITKDTQAFVGNHAKVDAKAHGRASEHPIFNGEYASDGDAPFATEGSFQGLAVQAASSEDLLGVAATVGGGFYAGLAGAVAIDLVESDTRAYVGDGAHINMRGGADTDQSVNVSAVNHTKAFTFGGGVAGGAVGISGGVDVGIIRNDTAAYIGNGAVVNATENIDVNALSLKDVRTVAVSGQGSLVGAMASVTVWTIGAALDDGYAEGSRSANALQERGSTDVTTVGNNLVGGKAADGEEAVQSGDQGDTKAGSSNSYLNILSGWEIPDLGRPLDQTMPDGQTLIAQETARVGSDIEDAAPTGVVSGTAEAEVPDVVPGTAIPSGTAAFIGTDATAVAEGDVNVRAREDLEFTAIAGSAGTGGVSLGASVVVTNIGTTTRAFVDEGAQVTAGSDDDNNVLVEAGSVENIDLKAYTGSLGGAASLGSTVAVLNDTSRQEAFIGDGAEIHRANTLEVKAKSTRQVIASNVGVQATFGPGVAAGATVTDVNLTGSTIAHIEGAYIGNGDEAVGGVKITARTNDTADVTAFAVAGGPGISGGGVIGQADISPTVEASTTGAHVQVKGTVSITADSTSDATSKSSGISGGAAAVSIMKPSASVTTQTRAFVGDDTTIETGALDITAGSKATALANGNGVSGGIASGQGVNVVVTVSPATRAEIGANASIATTDDLNVEAIAMTAEGDAIAASRGGGGVNVGVAYSELTVRPEVRAVVGVGSTILAGGNVSITAELKQEQDGESLGDTFNLADDVNPDTDQITFELHGLQTGDVVTYDDNCNENCAGQSLQTEGGALQEKREYGVIRVDENTIQLGAVFEGGFVDAGEAFGVEIGTSGIDDNRDLIVFGTLHNLETGDAVRSSARPDLLLYVRKIDDRTIELFKTREEAQARDLAFDVGQVEEDKLKISEHGLETGDRVRYLAPAAAEFSSTAVDAEGNIYLGSDTDDDGDDDAGPAFEVGDIVRYEAQGRAIAGLSTGETYFVKGVDLDRFTVQLAATSDGEAIDVDGSEFDESEWTSRHQLLPLPLEGLTNGFTYVVDKVDEGGFTLKDAAGPVSIGVGDAAGTHAFRKAGIDLTHFQSFGLTDVQSFHIDFVDPGDGYEDVENTLLGSEGVSLRTTNQPTGDGQSVSSAKGGGGGVIDVQVPTAKLDFEPILAASVAAKLIDAAGDVSIRSTTAGNVSSFADSKAGGFVKVGEVDATADVTINNNAYFGLPLPPDCPSNLSWLECGFYLLSWGIHVSEYGIPPVTADGVVIKAGGEFRVEATSVIYSRVEASAKGGGFVAVADADADADIVAKNNVIVGSNATIAARSVGLEARVVDIDTFTKSTAIAGGVGGHSKARADNDISSSAMVELGWTGADSGSIAGADGVNIEAVHGRVNADRSATAKFYGPFAGRKTPGDNSGTVTSSVHGFPGMTILAGPRSDDDPIALDVSAKVPNISWAVRQERIIWDSDAVLSPRNPELHVNEYGEIVRQVNVEVSINDEVVELTDITNEDPGSYIFDPERTGNGEIRFEGFEKVLITNESNKTLVMGGITGTVDGAIVDIANYGASDIEFKDGILDNPLGDTYIRNAGGDNLVDEYVIRAGALVLEATAGAIGTLERPLNVEIVDLGERPGQLSVVAGGDIHLDLTGQFRAPATSPTLGMERVSAGGDAAVTLQPGVQCAEEGTDCSPTESTYDFQYVEAAGIIDIAAFDPAAGAARVDVRGLTNLGPGGDRINVLTNGSIDLEEIVSADTADPNDLRVGIIESAAGDVTLTAPHSILDAVDDDHLSLGDPDRSANVMGTLLITLVARDGTVGLPTNLLEINLAPSGSLVLEAGEGSHVALLDDLCGALDATGTLVTLIVDGDICGSVDADAVGLMEIVGSMTGSGVIRVVHTIGSLEIGQDLAGLVEAGAIGTVEVGGSLTATGQIGVLEMIGTLEIGDDLAGVVEASTIEILEISNDLTGFVDVGAIGIVEIGHDLAGWVEVGTIGNVEVGNDLTGLVDTSTIGTLIIANDLAGFVVASGAISSLVVTGGSITPSAVIQAGSLDQLTIGPDQLSIGQNLAGTVTVAGMLGSVRVAGGTPGTIEAGHIGTVAVYGAYGPVVLRIIENGIERRVELAIPSEPFPQPDSTGVVTSGEPYVNVKYFYESGSRANPQLTARITNGIGSTFGPYDLSLVTYDHAAKFNLARLDAEGVAGVRNVAIEGDLLTQVSIQASSFFGPDSNSAGIRLPQDHLAGVGIRDFAPDRRIQAASIQAVAFGSHSVGNQTESGASADHDDAAHLLTWGTRIVPADGTYRVPFSALPAYRVGLFIATDRKGGEFDDDLIALTVQNLTVPNPALTANLIVPSNVERGAVTALVTAARTYDSKGRPGDSVAVAMALRGDGGSVETRQGISGPITSTGPLGDLLFLSGQAVGDVTAPSIFGSIISVGPIAGTIQTTGERIDPISGRTSKVNADFGRIYLDDQTQALTATTVVADGISGRLISRGDLLSRIEIGSGGLTGTVAAQGNLGAMITMPSGQTIRLGGVGISGGLAGEIVVLGTVLGDVRIDGGLKGGNLAAKGGILGNLVVNGGLDSGSSIVSGGQIGDSTLGTTFVLNGKNGGIIAAIGPINFWKRPSGNAAGNLYENVGASPGDQNAAAIRAIFTQDGILLAFDLTNLDLRGLAIIVEDLLALRVGAGRILTGPVA